MKPEPVQTNNQYTCARNLLVILAALALLGGLATWAWELYADSVGMSMLLVAVGALWLADCGREREIVVSGWMVPPKGRRWMS